MAAERKAEAERKPLTLDNIDGYLTSLLCLRSIKKIKQKLKALKDIVVEARLQQNLFLYCPMCGSDIREENRH